MPESDTLLLIRAAKEGDQIARERLFTRYYHKALTMVRFGLNPSWRKRLNFLQSTDIVQEVFLRAHKALSGFEPTSEGAFKFWLSRILENVIRDKLDYAAAQKRPTQNVDSLDRTISIQEDHVRLGDLIPGERTSPTQHILNGDISTAIYDLLHQLDEKDRQIIIQHEAGGLTYPEIASITGENADAVRKRFKRAFARLISLAEDSKAFQELRC